MGNFQYMSTHSRVFLWIRVVLVFLIGISILIWSIYKWYGAGFPLIENMRNKHGYLMKDFSEELATMLFGCLVCLGALGDFAFHSRNKP
jgi:hypothetical protein